VKALDALAARMILDRGDEAACHALTAEFSIDIKAGQPRREIVMRRLEFMQDQKTDAGRAPADESDERFGGLPALSSAW
jgi:hypothetical protein